MNKHRSDSENKSNSDFSNYIYDHVKNLDNKIEKNFETLKQEIEQFKDMNDELILLKAEFKLKPAISEIQPLIDEKASKQYVMNV